MSGWSALPGTCPGPWPWPGGRGSPSYPRFQLWHLVPQEEGFQKTQLACWEHLGRLAGR